jgi:mono/diheme cytochrome c family protein
MQGTSASANEAGAEAAAAVGTGACPLAMAAALYAANCQACHQANGEGLKGAFPAAQGQLRLSLDDDPSRILTIIMKGYNSREKEGYPAMPPIGVTNKLTPLTDPRHHQSRAQELGKPGSRGSP